MATEEQTAYTIGTYLFAGTRIRAGQRLTISNRIVSKLSLVLQKFGSPTGDVTFTIRKVSDDGILASKVWGDASALSTEITWEEATFDSPVTINEEVRLLVEFNSGDDSNFIRYYYQDTNIKADELRTYYIASYTDDSGSDAAYIYTYELAGETYDETGRLQIILAMQGGDAYPPFYNETGRIQIILGVQGKTDLATFLDAHEQIILGVQGKSALATFVDVHEQIIFAVQGGDAWPPPYDEKGRLQVVLAIVGRTDTYIVPLPFAYTVEIRDASANLIAMLENAHGIGYVQTINAPHSLKFSLPSDDGKLLNIILANQLWLRDCKTNEVVRKFQLQRKMDVRQ